MQRRTNIILDHNSICPGLNFLVPGECLRFDELLRMNDRVQSLKSIRVPANHPLDALIQLGVFRGMPECMKSDDLKNFQEKAEATAQDITCKINNEKDELLRQFDVKNLRQALEVLHFEDIEKTQTKVLICVHVNQESANMMLDENLQWRILTPDLYKLVCRQDQKKGFVVGLPVFMDECTEMYYLNNTKYVLTSQVPAKIFVYNAQGGKYIVLGAIENNLSYEEIMRHLYEGLNSLMDQEKFNRGYFSKKCIFILNNEEVYENFTYEEPQLSKKLKQTLNWENWYDNFCERVPKKEFEIFELAGQPKEKQYGFRKYHEDSQLFKNMEPTKKIKQNEQLHAGYVDAVNKTKSFQPTIIQDADLRSNNNSLGYGYENRGKMLFSDIVARVGQLKHQNHSSTDEGSPQSMIQESIYAELSRINKKDKDESRIYYKIWKNEQDVQSLAQLANEKMNDQICVPFSNFKSIPIVKSNRKILFLGGRPNQIITNSNGQKIEQQWKEVMSNKNPSNEKTQFLDDLAKQILDLKKKSDASQPESKELVEQVREKIDIEVQTSKNEATDELDEFMTQKC